jgi:hypothetical protein
MMNGQLALATVALLVRKSGGVAGLKRSFRRQAVTRQKQESTNDAARWLAEPHLFLTPNHFAADLRGSARIKNQKLISSLDSFARAKFCRGLCVRDLFSRGFHRIGAGFTASAQFILRFAFHSLMLRLQMGQSAIETGNQNYGDY